MDEWIYAPAPGIRIRAFDGLKVKTMSSQIPKPHFKLIKIRFSLFSLFALDLQPRDHVAGVHIS